MKTQTSQIKQEITLAACRRVEKIEALLLQGQINVHKALAELKILGGIPNVKRNRV